MNRRLIIALHNSANKGKSLTLLALGSLVFRYQCEIVFLSSGKKLPSKKDFTMVFKLNGKNIAIISKGDPGTNLQERIKEVVEKYNCVIIVCASRTRGETMQAIETIASKLAFEILWTSTYVGNESIRPCFNELKASHIFNTIEFFLLDKNLEQQP